MVFAAVIFASIPVYRYAQRVRLGVLTIAHEARRVEFTHR